MVWKIWGVKLARWGKYRRLLVGLWTSFDYFLKGGGLSIVHSEQLSPSHNQTPTATFEKTDFPIVGSLLTAGRERFGSNATHQWIFSIGASCTRAVRSATIGRLLIWLGSLVNFTPSKFVMPWRVEHCYSNSDFNVKFYKIGHQESNGISILCSRDLVLPTREVLSKSYNKFPKCIRGHSYKKKKYDFTKSW